MLDLPSASIALFKEVEGALRCRAMLLATGNMIVLGLEANLSVVCAVPSLV